jgi:alkaline phosphatase D
MSDVTRRSLLKGLGAAGLTAATLPGLLAAAPTVPGALNQSVPTGADVDTVVFPSGVASGDPTPTGAIVWVRAAPAAIAATPDTELVLIVARDAALTERVLTRVVAPDELALRGAERDGTVRVDIDGMLPTADTHYYYRWFLGGAASRLGRLRTTPAAGTMVNHLRFGVYSCSNYPAGQFNAYGAGARDGLDYVIHVGDWLYEGASGNGSGERDVVIESGASRMSSLADCYDIHRTYRTDPHVQDLLAMHTLIATWDDHETVNNPWYDYAAAAHDSSSHPNEGDHDFMRKYFLEAATAYHDYIPNRTFLDEQAVREQVLDNDQRGSDVSPKAAFKLWRKIAFGDLLDLIMVDGRWYRTRGFDTDSSQGNDSVAATSSASEKQGTEYGESSTMLGLEQAQWVVDTIGASTARWRVLGNQTIFQSWGAMLPGPSRAYINMDAWDGYRAERATIIDAMAPKGNNVVLTGDMHAFVWGHVQTEYGVEGEATGRKVAYEMMTTSVTSTGLFFFAAPNDNVTIPGMEEALEATQLALNPHMDLFNWTRHGYIVMDVTPDHIEAVAYITGINTFEAAPKATPYFGVRIPSNPGGEVKAEVLLRRSPSGVPVSPSRPRPSQAFALPAAGAQPTQLSSWDQIESLLGDPDEVVRHYNAEL